MHSNFTREKFEMQGERLKELCSLNWRLAVGKGCTDHPRRALPGFSPPSHGRGGGDSIQAPLRLLVCLFSEKDWLVSLPEECWRCKKDWIRQLNSLCERIIHMHTGFR